MSDRKPADLTLRRHARNDFDLPGEFEIAPEMGPQVRFTHEVEGASPDRVPVRIIDLSRGGAGWECPVFLPRECEGTLRVRGSKDAGAETLFEQRVQVRRVRMTEGRTDYQIGGVFLGEVDRTRAVIERVLDASARDDGGAAA